MPAPEPNLGGAPNDIDDVQDLWYALQEIGFTEGVIGQTDFDFVNDDTLSANGEARLEVRAPGGDKINGQVVSDGQFSCDVEWLDSDGNIVRNEGVFSNREADIWANFSIDPKSPFANVVIINDESTDQTVSGTVHYR